MNALGRMKTINKKNRELFIKETINELLKSGAKEIKEDNILSGRRFRLQTANNFINVRLEDKKSVCFSIYGRYDHKPTRELNAKNNFHWGDDLVMALAMMKDYVFAIQQDEKYK